MFGAYSVLLAFIGQRLPDIAWRQSLPFREICIINTRAVPLKSHAKVVYMQIVYWSCKTDTSCTAQIA